MAVMTRYNNISRQDMNEVRIVVDGDATFYVYRFDVCSSPIVDYVVLEKMASCVSSTHSSFYTSIEGMEGYFGELDSRRLPADLEALKPMSQERSERVEAWQNALEAQAQAYVLQAFPEDF